MNVSTLIAKRYLFAKKSRNVINLISFISFFGLLVSSASLVIILSGFNGIQKYVEDTYGKHAADIYITPQNGKIIPENHPVFDTLNQLKEIKYYTKSIEETALLKFGNQWATTTVKGINSNVYNLEDWKESIISGDGKLYFDNLPAIILGPQIKFQLQIPADFISEIKVYSVSRQEKLSVQNQNSLTNNRFLYGGTFSVNPDLDNSTAIVDYEIANDIFKMNNGATSIELFLEKDIDISIFQQKLNNFKYALEYKTHEEKNKLIYAANDAEKWMVLSVLLFVLILSSFTIIASITMLIIEKKKDIKTLIAIGATNQLIKAIFFKEGLFINLLGSFIGLLIGLFICWLQEEFHFLSLDESAALSYWPVLIKWIDILMLALILIITGTIAAYLPSKLLMNKLIRS